MEIVNKSKDNIAFCKLAKGQCFKHGTYYYIKTGALKDDGLNVNSIDLETGDSCYFEDFEEVLKSNSKIVDEG